MKLRGRCLCGHVSYEVTGEPAFTGVCHCANCQRQSGSAFSIIVAVPSTAVTRSGELKTYNDRGASGAGVQRLFCPDCGSPVFSILESMPGMTFIKAGTLDDTSWLEPRFSVWCKSAQPWLKVEVGGSNFAENPPSPG